MKTTLLIATLMMSLGFAKPIVETDLSKVYGAGATATTLAPQVKLKPGVYAIGDEDSKMTGTHYLIVDEFINNSDKGLALLINQEGLKERQRTTGRFYMIRSIRGGTALMLSAVTIGMNGQLSVHSEIDGTGQSPVLEISVAPDANKLRYPFIVQGHYGALNGQLMGMRAKSDQNPLFRPWPQHSVFNAETTRGQLVVSGTTVAIHDSNRLDQRFELVPMNGDLGKMAALVSTRLDTMEEDYVSDTNILKLAFFLTLDDCEIFIVANPAISRPGEYVMDFYGPRHRTFLDYFAKGKLNP